MDKSQAQGCDLATQVSVLELPWLERTLLWSIRTWAAYHDAPQSVWRPLESAFTEAGIRPALEPFAQLMCALFAGLKRNPDIRCVRCLRLGKDESALLATLAMAVQASPSIIERRLSTLMLPLAARTGARAALAMMRIVVNAGWHMQQVHADTEAAYPHQHSQPISMTTH